MSEERSECRREEGRVGKDERVEGGKAGVCGCVGVCASERREEGKGRSTGRETS